MTQLKSEKQTKLPWLMIDVYCLRPLQFFARAKKRTSYSDQIFAPVKRRPCCRRDIMELPDTFYNHSDYIETTAGNKVSRQSILCGSQNIVLNGKTIVKNDCIIRGDLANVRIGRQVRGCVSSARLWLKFNSFKTSRTKLQCWLPPEFEQLLSVMAILLFLPKQCVIGERSVIRPPFKKFMKGVAFFPLHIGDHVLIEEDCVVNAAQVGSYVHIGRFIFQVFHVLLVLPSVHFPRISFFLISFFFCLVRCLNVC